MIKSITPNMVWGTIHSKNDFTRLNLHETNEHLNAIAKYNAGMFIVVLPKAKMTSLKITFVVHYPYENDIHDHFQADVKKAGFYTVIKVNNQWKSIDVGKVFDRSFGETIANISDKKVTIEHNLIKYPEISELQINFPVLGFTKELIIDCDVDFEIKMPSPVKTIFLGSSIATFNFVESHNSAPNYLYRIYGLNTCTAAIPKSHSFNCPELMKELLNNYDNVEKILVDLENLKFENLNTIKTYLKKIDCFIYKPSLVHHDLNKIIKVLGLKNILEANAEMCCDWGHPNVYGIIKYTEWLIKNKKIIKEDYDG